MNTTTKTATTFKNWMIENFEYYQLSDIVNHGVDGGFPGLIYYTETCELYAQYKADIWEMLADDADSLGETIPSLIAGFNGANNVCDALTFENLMVWYAAERVARDLVEEKTEDEYEASIKKLYEHQ